MVSAIEPILEELDRIIDEHAGRLEVRMLGKIVDGGRSFPLRSLCLGSA